MKAESDMTYLMYMHQKQYNLIQCEASFWKDLLKTEKFITSSFMVQFLKILKQICPVFKILYLSILYRFVDIGFNFLSFCTDIH